MEPIQTNNVYPPIPDRRWDWVAYRDPERRSGFGPTEEDAILDLLQEEYEAEEDGEWTGEEQRKFLDHTTHLSLDDYDSLPGDSPLRNKDGIPTYREAYEAHGTDWK